MSFKLKDRNAVILCNTLSHTATQKNEGKKKIEEGN